jgi:hypothetical protein
MFRFDPYLDLFADGSDAADDGATAQPTQYEDGESPASPGDPLSLPPLPPIDWPSKTNARQSTWSEAKGPGI